MPVTSFPRPVQRIFVATNRSHRGRVWGDWMDVALRATQLLLEERHRVSVEVMFAWLLPAAEAEQLTRIDTLVVYEGGVRRALAS